jgi:hypothetical protein
VEKGSPADDVFLVGDAILGVGGKPFSYDPRTEFGNAESYFLIGDALGEGMKGLLKE